MRMATKVAITRLTSGKGPVVISNTGTAMLMVTKEMLIGEHRANNKIQ